MAARAKYLPFMRTSADEDRQWGPRRCYSDQALPHQTPLREAAFSIKGKVSPMISVRPIALRARAGRLGFCWEPWRPRMFCAAPFRSELRLKRTLECRPTLGRYEPIIPRFMRETKALLTADEKLSPAARFSVKGARMYSCL